MPIALHILAALSLCYAGMAALCLAMDRHHAQVWRRAPRKPARRGLRIAGWLLLAVAVVPCVRGWGATVGVVAWFGFLSAAALLLVFLLPYRPRAAAALGGAALAAGLVLVMLPRVG